MQGTKVSDVDVRIEKNETSDLVVAAREGDEVMVLQFYYRLARSTTEITLTTEEAMNLVHRIAFELCKRRGQAGVARKEQAMKDKVSNRMVGQRAEITCPVCGRFGMDCICQEPGGGVAEDDDTDQPSECEACDTDETAGPILGVLSNGKRCDRCGIFATDEAAKSAVAAFVLGKAGAA